MGMMALRIWWLQTIRAEERPLGLGSLDVVLEMTSSISVRILRVFPAMEPMARVSVGRMV